MAIVLSRPVISSLSSRGEEADLEACEVQGRREGEAAGVSRRETSCRQGGGQEGGSEASSGQEGRGQAGAFEAGQEASDQEGHRQGAAHGEVALVDVRGEARRRARVGEGPGAHTRRGGGWGADRRQL